MSALLEKKMNVKVGAKNIAVPVSTHKAISKLSKDTGRHMHEVVTALLEFYQKNGEKV